MGLTQKLGTLPIAVYTDTSNNVGIGGAPSGSYKFEVTGTAKVSGAATFTSSVTIQGSGSSIQSGNELRFYRADNAIYTKMYDAGSLAANGFTFNNMNSEGFHFQNNGTTIMRMNSSGNVGIGTSSPRTNLSVTVGTTPTSVPSLGTANQGFAVTNDTNTYGINIGTLNTGNAFIQAMRFDSTATAYNILLNPSGGNVGIGTTSPGGKLQVEGGELRVTTSNAGVAAYYTSGNGEIASYNWGGGAWIPQSYAAQYHIWKNSGTEVMRITSGGVVGIGTTSPITSTKLSVAGGIAFGNNTDGTVVVSYGGRISAKSTSVTGGGGATLIHRGLGSVGYFILVSGISGQDRFTDLIYGTYTTTVNVLASATNGSAPTRTYSMTSENIYVSLSGGASWTVVTTGLGAMES